jgi:pimeloyl-ACP methyl ester carboxylesterase
LVYEQFAAFTQDAADNKAFAAGSKFAMPVLAIGGDKSFGTMQAEVMRFVARDVIAQVIANSGHWLMEEQREPTVAAIKAFLG